MVRSLLGMVRGVRDDLRTPTVWPELDGIRGVAVVAAVSWHVLRLYPAAHITSDSVPLALWPLGVQRFAVDAFFVLSGFLVVRSWQTIRRSASAGRAWIAFLGRRAARIVPAYWVSLLILVPLVAPVLFDQPRRLLAFFTLNQYLKFWLPERVNVVYWSLTTEWHFYLLVPVVSWLLVRVGRWPLLAACLCTSVAWYLQPPFRLPAGFVFGRLDQFVAGAVVGQLLVAHARGESSPIVRLVSHRYAGPILAAGLLALGTYHGATFGMGSGAPFDALVRPLAGLFLAAGLLRVLTGTSPRVLLHPVSRYLGTISFGLYIWHYPILDHGRALRGIGTPFPDALWSAIVVAGLCALAVAAATVSYVLVERPFVRRKQAAAPPPGASPPPSERERGPVARPASAVQRAGRLA